MRVLVTGGAGFLGHHLVEQLLTRRYDVTILDNFSKSYIGKIRKQPANGKVTLVEGDIRDATVVEKCSKNVDCVVHLAAITSVPYSVENPSETFDVNVNGTLNLLNASSNNEVETFVLASSSAVYGEAQRVPLSEDHPLYALSPYASSKIASESHCRAFKRQRGLGTFCFRLFNLYGAFQGNGGQGVVSSFAKRLAGGSAPVIYGDGEQTRDFIHVNDVVEALISLLEKPTSEDVCNLGSGVSVTVNQLAQKVVELSGVKWEGFEYRPTRPGDIRRSQADITRLAGRLGFKPSIGLDEGLSMVLGEMNASTGRLT